MVGDINKMLKQTKKLLSKMVRGERGLNSHTAAGDRALMVLNKQISRYPGCQRLFMRGFRFRYSLLRMRSLGFVTRSFSSQKERLRGRLVQVDFGGFFPAASTFGRRWVGQAETEARPRTRKNSDIYWSTVILTDLTMQKYGVSLLSFTITVSFLKTSH